MGLTSLLRKTPNIALALVDVVMETSDAGLRLVEVIRKDLKNSKVRVIVRTGQPGIAPEKYVIDHYDIDDYKEKTELTAQKLYTVVRSALKSYRDLETIEQNKNALEQILHITPKLFSLNNEAEPLSVILNHLLNLNRSNGEYPESTPDYSGMITLSDNSVAKAVATYVTGKYANDKQLQETIVAQTLASTWVENNTVANQITIPFKLHNAQHGVIILEKTVAFSEDENKLIMILANQCISALDSYHLYQDLGQVNEQLSKSNEQITYMLAMASEFKDSETGNHINRIAKYTEIIARRAGLTATEAIKLGLASTLHDLGKLGIPDHILQKPGKLTDEEFDAIKTHPRLGAQILSSKPWLNLARGIAYSHHEKWDGSGYPDGKKEGEIPFPARIVAVADVFDALVSKRPYKDPWPVKKAVEEIVRCRGTQFDPAIVDAFLALYEDGTLEATRESYPVE